ncbi:MAG: trypsin-like peptidase domain-containing protein [Granulosicoccaceae bacterium]
MTVLIRITSIVGLIAAVCLPQQLQAADDRWADVVSRAANSVVSLQLSNLRDFNDSTQGGSSATGFVVDAERGIILTNRHVVGSGPIRMSATFQNQERVDVLPLYRDPVHDFGFIRYNPEDIKYAQPESLLLRSDKASTGLDIRVIGSDGGEQLSILAGTIARLDREVPGYGRYGYNDFNTFYFQAAASSSGGSSGSPVINIDGDVVALNAAANTKTASSFFLPLDRIQYALNKLQAEEPIARGSLLTIFEHKPFRELSRLGLSGDTEETLREDNPDNNGMLVASQVIPAANPQPLQEGDILVAIDGEYITGFVELEALLDERAGQWLTIHVIRQGELAEETVFVTDLHKISPKRFVELGDSILQDMSIQHARAMNKKTEGVILAQPGYIFERAGIPVDSIITELDGQKVANLDDFLRILGSTPVDEKVLTRFIVPGKEFSSSITQIEVGDKWFGHRECLRVDDVRYWDCKAVNLDRPKALTKTSSIVVPKFDQPLLSQVAPAMVRVDFSSPYQADNVYAQHFNGVGLIIDKERGLVVVDRNTVPIGLGDVDITFFGSKVIKGQVVFLHPRHNIALLSYDPELIKGADFEPLQLANASDELPDSLTMVGYRADGTFRQHDVDDFSRLTISFSSPRLPRFQQAPIDVYGLPSVPPSLGGPFVDENGLVHAVYMSFAYEDGREIHQREWAMPAAVIKEALRMYTSGSSYYSLDVMLDYRSISEAAQLGLPEEWITRFNDLDSDFRKVLYIEQVVPSTQAFEKLQTGDILLAINGELVSDLFRVELNSQQTQIQLSLLRGGKIIELTLEPSALNALGTQRLISWAGALFQEKHLEIGFSKGVDFSGVYIADTAPGSPALWDGLYRNRMVSAVDGEPVESLDDMLVQIMKKKQDEITRLSLISMSGRKSVMTLQPEYHFWPTFEIRRDAAGWQRIEHNNNTE